MRTLALPLGGLWLSLFSVLPIYSQDDLAPNKTDTASTLHVDKIEPPSWWRGSTLSPIRILVTGTGFDPGVIIETGTDSLQAYNYRTSQNGHYLFFDLEIAPECPISRHRLIVRKSNGETDTIEFDVMERPDFAPKGFNSDDFIYFVIPDRFCDGDLSNNRPEKSSAIYDRTKPRHYHGGDLRGLESRLPFLSDLGMTAIWTTPIYDNNDGLDFLEAYPNEQNVKEPTTGYHGYGAIDMYSVDEHLGSLEDLKHFVRSAHDRGMKVIQDQVANHTGPYHRWAKDPPTATWWNGTFENHIANNWQKWTAMNPRATPQTQQQNLDGWFIDILPDFNQNDPEVARYLIQNSLWWLATVQFDAIRMDTLPHVPRNFWKEWTSAIKREFPTTVILGELFDSDPALLSYYQAGRIGHDGIDTGIQSLFDFGLFGPIRKVFAKGNSIREIHQMFARDWLYPDPNSLTTFAGVHDMQRFMNEEGATVDGLMMALTLIATSRGTPLIYYGDEIAMRGGNDPDNRRDFPGGFPQDAKNAFEPSGRNHDENRMWKHTTRLGKLRQELESLRRGRSYDLLDSEQQYAYARVLPDQMTVMVFNNATESAECKFSIKSLSIETLKKGWDFQCDDELETAPPLVVAAGVASVTLPARSAAIFVLPQ
ncbi:MAG: hypothetical protein FJ308_01395 [Planctomycetes bacterium]|nr:hypothetical protein [Planctomycetota bacterium]